MGIIAWLFSMFWFVINIVDIPKQIKIGSKHILFAIPHLLLGIVLLAAGAWVTDFSTNLKNYTRTIGWITIRYNYDKYKVSAAFGIISGIIFLADAVLYFLWGKEYMILKPLHKRLSSL